MSASKRKNLNNMEVDNKDDSSSSDEDDDEPHPDAYRGNEVGTAKQSVHFSYILNELFPKEVQIEFEGRAPVDPDAQGISQLLQRLFLRAHINCNQMADLLIGNCRFFPPSSFGPN